jgi:hypothetical protein
MIQIDAECSSCGGTGLYSGMCEGPGIAVVCLRCEGTGCEKVYYRPFAGRKKKKGIKVVYRSGGGFIATGCGPRGNGITYKEFEAGKFPPEGKGK